MLRSCRGSCISMKFSAWYDEYVRLHLCCAYRIFCGVLFNAHECQFLNFVCYFLLWNCWNIGYVLGLKLGLKFPFNLSRSLHKHPEFLTSYQNGLRHNQSWQLLPSGTFNLAATFSHSWRTWRDARLLLLANGVGVVETGFRRNNYYTSNPLKSRLPGTFLAVSSSARLTFIPSGREMSSRRKKPARERVPLNTLSRGKKKYATDLSDPLALNLLSD